MLSSKFSLPIKNYEDIQDYDSTLIILIFSHKNSKQHMQYKEKSHKNLRLIFTKTPPLLKYLRKKYKKVLAFIFFWA